MSTPPDRPLAPPLMAPTIRRARADELGAVGRLTVDAYVRNGVIAADAHYLEFLGDAVRRDAEAEVWVAVDERGVVGTVTVVEPASTIAEVSRDGEVEMRSLAVDPAASREGIGEALARHTVDLARDRGFRAVVLSSSTTMHTAHRIYERLGFTRLPERDWSPVPGVELIAYVLPL